MKILKEIDPVASATRKARYLHRRKYFSPGPNYCWHVDGYDKLKPYGLPMHGCIDGFSRKIIWLKVTRTNNDPIMPAFFYFQVVKSFGYCPFTIWIIDFFKEFLVEL